MYAEARHLKYIQEKLKEKGYVWTDEEIQKALDNPNFKDIIDKDVWQVVQTYKAVRINDPRKAEFSDRAFTGILFCGYCGSPYVYASKSRGKIRLLCNSRDKKTGCEKGHYIDEQELEKTIKNHLLNNCFSFEKLEEMYKDFVKLTDKNNLKTKVNLTKNKSELKKLCEKESNLVKAVEDNLLPASTIKARIEEINRLKNKYSAMVTECEKSIIYQKSFVKNGNERDFAKYIRQIISESSGGNLRNALKSLGVKLYAKELYQIDIECKLADYYSSLSLSR